MIRGSTRGLTLLLRKMKGETGRKITHGGSGPNDSKTKRWFDQKNYQETILTETQKKGKGGGGGRIQAQYGHLWQITGIRGRL